MVRTYSNLVVYDRGEVIAKIDGRRFVDAFAKLLLLLLGIPTETGTNGICFQSET